MRQHVDADAERLQFRDALEHFHGNADSVQAERKRQPADAAAGDEYRHDKTPPIAGVLAQAGGGGQLRRAKLVLWTWPSAAVNFQFSNEV